MMDKIDSVVAGKNIIIVGPAGCVYDDCSRVDFDDYDLIVRVNHHYLKESPENRAVLGPRTDIVYHSLGKPYTFSTDVDYYNEMGIKVVTRFYKKNPVPTYDGKLVCVDNLYHVSEDDLLYFSNLNKCNVQTGNMAILHLLSLVTASVTVVGFDFYQSLYSYDDNEEIRRRHVAGDVGSKVGEFVGHDPIQQFKYFKENVYNVNKKFIPIGKLRELFESSLG